MRVERKIFGAEMLRRLWIGGVVQQDCAQDRALGIHAGGHSAIKNTVSSRHSKSQGSLLSGAKNTALAGEKPAKHANLNTKKNPVRTSHTDRASGVDVLPSLCCRSGVWQFSKFLSRSFLLE